MASFGRTCARYSPPSCSAWLSPLADRLPRCPSYRWPHDPRWSPAAEYALSRLQCARDPSSCVQGRPQARGQGHAAAQGPRPRRCARSRIRAMLLCRGYRRHTLVQPRPPLRDPEERQSGRWDILIDLMKASPCPSLPHHMVSQNAPAMVRATAVTLSGRAGSRVRRGSFS
jgi:hypothetical protein